MAITAERLRELQHYNPDTGIFTWRVRTAKSVHVGDVAGYSFRNGYIRMKVDGHYYLAHRLVWLWVTGEWPAGDLDHINGNKADNRWNNIRLATRSQNMANIRAHTDNISGFKGVSWNKALRKWRAHIGVGGKHIYLGGFDTAAKAYAVYCLAARRHHGEFARVYEADQLIIPRKIFEERVLRNLLIATQPDYARAA